MKMSDIYKLKLYKHPIAGDWILYNPQGGWVYKRFESFEEARWFLYTGAFSHA